MTVFVHIQTWKGYSINLSNDRREEVQAKLASDLQRIADEIADKYKAEYPDHRVLVKTRFAGGVASRD